MKENKKSLLKKWWVWAIVVVVLAAAAGGASQASTAEMTYTVEGHTAGDATGNVVELDNGNYTTADLPAGTYDVSNIGWADLINTTSPMKIITSSTEGTYNGLVIEEDTTIEILNQNNAFAIGEAADDTPIIFTEVYSDTVESKEVTEKVEIKNEEVTCYVGNLKSECSELENYETLKAEAEGKE
jgi:hypothetical protein